MIKRMIENLNNAHISREGRDGIDMSQIANEELNVRPPDNQSGPYSLIHDEPFGREVNRAQEAYRIRQ